MKSLKKFFLLIAVTAFSIGIFAQPMPPEDFGNNEDVEIQGGGAPIQGGLAILIGLSMAYAGFRSIQRRKDKENQL